MAGTTCMEISTRIAANLRTDRILAPTGPRRKDPPPAPPGFLLAEGSAFRPLGDRSMAFRLVPLLGGIASLFLIREVARRCLPARAVWLAVALLAVANDPIYFASEAKQYSTDATAA